MEGHKMQQSDRRSIGSSEIVRHDVKHIRSI